MKKNLLIIFFIIISYASDLISQTETFVRGSYIVNMGVVPQTAGNGLKPYGMVYDLVKNHSVTVKWIIRQGKAKDSFDFIHNGVRYKGGTFIIPKQYINPTVLTRIAYWRTQGVVLDTFRSNTILDVAYSFNQMPRWTISNDNTSIGVQLFTVAGLPNTAYNTKAVSTLGACDDIYVLPHADPTWATHNNLYTWNTNHRGAIWAICHAVSVLEGLSNPSNASQRMNFLSNMGLINFKNHADATPAYNYLFNRANYNGSPISSRADDPVFQMIGREDNAHTNGSEQVFIPLAGAGSGWRNTTKIGCYDSTQSNVTAFPNGPAALTVYGRGFGNVNNGLVMYQGGHNIAETKVGPNRIVTAENVSAVRQFFNFSFIAMGDKNPAVLTSTVPSIMNSGTGYTLSVSATSPVSSTLTYSWTSSCGGVFSNPTSSTTTFTPPLMGAGNTNCVIYCEVTDACNRVVVNEFPVNVYLVLPVELLSFEAIPDKQNIHVKWTVSSESDVKSFDVLRSYDGNNFEKINTILQQSGNEDKVSDYLCVDQSYSRKSSIIYYQLQVNDNGYGFKSEIVQVENENNLSQIKAIWPNPSNQILNIETKQNGSYFQKINIYDITGKLVDVISVFDDDSNIIKIDVSLYLTGLYFINFVKKNGEIIKSRFTKG